MNQQNVNKKNNKKLLYRQNNEHFPVLFLEQLPSIFPGVNPVRHSVNLRALWRRHLKINVTLETGRHFG